LTAHHSANDKKDLAGAADETSGDAHRRRLVHGRTRGPRLSARRQRLVDETLPRLRIEIDEVGAGALDPLSLFPQGMKAAWLEIGFGGGEHLIWQAERNPDIGFIGCEPYVNGVAALLAAIDEKGLSNIRIHDDDAAFLLDLLAPSSIERAFILHPDPWPKKRHWKRRFINQGNLDRLARILESGGELRFATDIPHYAAWTLKRMARRDDFLWTARAASDWRERPGDWPATRYGLKAEREGRPPIHLSFTKKAS
jgi:tRNA (guanine-N7-)-methyltransferase